MIIPLCVYVDPFIDMLGDYDMIKIWWSTQSQLATLLSPFIAHRRIGPMTDPT